MTNLLASDHPVKRRSREKGSNFLGDNIFISKKVRTHVVEFSCCYIAKSADNTFRTEHIGSAQSNRGR